MISIAHFYAHSFSDLWSTCSKDAFVLQEPVHLTYDLQKRGGLRVKIILPVAEWRGPQQLPKGKKTSENVKPRLFGIIGKNEEETSEELTKQIQEALYKIFSGFTAGVWMFCVQKLR